MGHLFSSSEETRYYWLEHQNEDFGAYIWRDAIRRSSEAQSRLTFQETWLADGFCKRKRKTLLDRKTSIYRIFRIAISSPNRFLPVILLRLKTYGVSSDGCTRLNGIFRKWNFSLIFFWRTLAFFHSNPEKKAEIKTFWAFGFSDSDILGPINLKFRKKK